MVFISDFKNLKRIMYTLCPIIFLEGLGLEFRPGVQTVTVTLNLK
jgi:hypothetical protein